MRIVKGILIVILILTFTLAVAGYLFLNSDQPQYTGEVYLDGLNSTVEVYFDDFGIPHIYADSEKDAYFGLGYVHAQDRLFQMELLRRVGAGKLAEIFGPELEDTDKFLRTIGIDEVAKWSSSTYLVDDKQPFQQAAFSYLNGINAFLHNGPTPIEFTLLGIPKEEFKPVDIYRILGYMGFNFNTAVRTDPLLTAIKAKLGPDYLKDLVLNTVKSNTTIPTYPSDTSLVNEITGQALSVLERLPVAPWMGSNSWVIGPEKSAQGYPLLANDTHIGFSQPAVWYEAHLNYPGLNFYGYYLAGFPFGLIGRNEFSSWGITIFPNDDMDFYREKVNPQNPDQVWNKDHWENLTIRKESITIKGANQQEFEVRTSRHGPIINEVNQLVDSIESQPVSFFWSYMKFPCKALQAAYGIGRSNSMAEFKSAVGLLEAPGINFTYADTTGNIGWWAAARLLKRPEHVEPKLILDGSTGLDDPLGWYPFSANPKSENPPQGFVYSANNQPDSTNGVLHPGYYYPGLRGQRIIELLEQKDNWEVADFKKMMLDDQSPQYPQIAKRITSLLGEDMDQDEVKVIDLLNSWDGRHGLEDVGPTIYYHLINNILRRTIQDELGRENFNVFTTTQVARRTLPFLMDNDTSIWWDDISTPEKEKPLKIIRESFQQTVKLLKYELGADPALWHWGKVHTLEHMHAIGRRKPLNYLFNVGPFPVTGGDEVINKMDFDRTASRYQVKSGPSMRMIVDLANMQQAYGILPTGQSGHLSSPHYKDQVKLYNSGELRPQYMDKQEIAAEAGHPLILTPR
ncbi:MAG: penicillin amidase [Cyclobacteriaceae bacterium]|nr:MAG: penicillin amidase [Cyclobacteriaceae bacterium]